MDLFSFIIGAITGGCVGFIIGGIVTFCLIGMVMR